MTALSAPTVLTGHAAAMESEPWRDWVGRPPADASWLDSLNFYRSLADLPPVVENAEWQPGIEAHGHYVWQEQHLTHPQDPDSPWYTPEGDAAGRASNLFWSSGGRVSDRYDVERWMASPGHFWGMIHPNLEKSAYGFFLGDGTKTMNYVSGIDVIRGRSSPYSHAAKEFTFPSVARRIDFRGANLVANFDFGEDPTFEDWGVVRSDGHIVEVTLWHPSKWGPTDGVILQPHGPLDFGYRYYAYVVAGGRYRYWWFDVGEVDPATMFVDVPQLISAAESLGSGNEAAAHKPQCDAADPVNCATGNFWLEFADVVVPSVGPSLALDRTYNSLAAGDGGPFGYGWSSSYAVRLEENPATGMVTFVQESGSTVDIGPVSGGDYAPTSEWAQVELERTSEGWRLVRHRREIFEFNGYGDLVAMVDLNGYRKNIIRDENGQVTSVVDPVGRELQLVHDEDGRIIEAIDPLGRAITYDYDLQGNLVAVTNVDEGVWTFEYDDAHRMVSFTDPEGGTVTNRYDDTGRVLEQTDQVGATTNFEWNGSETLVINPNGVTTAQYYQGGVLRHATQAVGTAAEATWTYDYDPSTLGRTLVLSPTGKVTTAEYDEFGNRTVLTDPEGHTTRWTYGEHGQPLTMTDASGVTTRWSYDDRANVLEVSRTLTETGEDVVTTFEYGLADLPGMPTAVIDPEGTATTFAYDAAGNPTSATDALGNTTTRRHDGLGRVIEVVAPSGNAAEGDHAEHRSVVTYTPSGDVASMTDPTGTTVSYEYDLLGRVVSHTGPDGHAISFSYDPLGRLVETVQADGTVLAHTYDGAGNLTAKVDGAGQVTAYAYDAAGRLASVTDPLGRTSIFAYDAAGRRSAVTHPDGETTRISYDATGRPTAIAYSDGQTPSVEFDYDEVGRRVAMRDGTGRSTYSYDSLGRLIKAVDGRGQTVSYEYDRAGRATRITYPSRRDLVREFDAAGQLVALTVFGTLTTTFSYDANGNLVRIEAGNDTVSEFDYDHANRATGIRHYLDPDELDTQVRLLEFDYTRTESGLVATESTRGLLAAFSDELGIDLPEAPDPTSFDYTSRHQLAAVNDAPYSYDAANNLTGLADGSALSYDAANQLTTITGADGQVTRFDYDERGRRTAAVPDDPLERVEYVYNQADQLTEYRTVQVDPAGLLASGRAHSLALSADGQVFAWGDNTFGQLGDDTTESRHTPVAVDIANVTSIAAGSHHSLAVMADGGVSVWGDNRFGQVGWPLGEVRTRPHYVAGPKDVVAAAGGSRHSLAVTDAGHVWAWGRAGIELIDDHTLLDEPLPDPLPASGDLLADTADFVPGLVPGPTDAVAVAAGGYSDQPGHSLVLTQDGTVWSFGANNRGQLGTGSTDDQAVALPIMGLNDVVAIDAAGDASFAVTASGEVFAWGDNTHGQLGVGSDQPYIASPTRVVGIDDAVEVAAGLTHTLVRTSDAAIYGWGANGAGQIGCTNSAGPVRVEGLEPATTLSAGGSHTLSATVTGTVQALGANDHGQLGTGATDASCTPIGGHGLERIAAWPGRAASYTYDGDGLRATKTVDRHYALNTPVSDRQPMVWDRTSPIPKLLYDGIREFIYGPGGMPVSQITVLPTGGIIDWLHTDQLGSVRAVTTADGVQSAAYSYDAYGNPTIVKERDLPDLPGRQADTDRPNDLLGGITPLRFAGEYHDHETGFTYLRARTYDPATGQFLTRDPLAEVTNTPYLYADGNPTNLTDPTGLCPFCVVALIGILAGAATDIGFQAVGNALDGCAPLDNLNWNSVAVSGALGGATGGFGHGVRVARGANRVAATRAVSGAAETVRQARFAPGRWLTHFEKHGASNCWGGNCLGYANSVEYLRGAQSLSRGGTGVQTFTRKSGDTLFYRSATNEFAALSPDNIIRTYFKPDNGYAYWLQQIGGG